MLVGRVGFWARRASKAATPDRVKRSGVDRSGTGLVQAALFCAQSSTKDVEPVSESPLLTFGTTWISQ